MHNKIDLILSNTKVLDDNDPRITINLTDSMESEYWEDTLDLVMQYLKEYTYFTLDTSYRDLEYYTNNETIDNIILFGAVAQELTEEYEFLLLQATLTLGREMGVETLTEILDVFMDLNMLGVATILSTELYEYAYHNGIIIDDMPPHATTEDVEREFIVDVLEPAGYIYMETDSGLSGYIDPEVVYVLGGD